MLEPSAIGAYKASMWVHTTQPHCGCIQSLNMGAYKASMWMRTMPQCGFSGCARLAVPDRLQQDVLLGANIVPGHKIPIHGTPVLESAGHACTLFWQYMQGSFQAVLQRKGTSDKAAATSTQRGSCWQHGRCKPERLCHELYVITLLFLSNQMLADCIHFNDVVSTHICTVSDALSKVGLGLCCG
jgi:hypothetical protein